jgi:NADH-ubiquinone oxidoreductase chain 2
MSLLFFIFLNKKNISMSAVRCRGLGGHVPLVPYGIAPLGGTQTQIMVITSLMILIIAIALTPSNVAATPLSASSSLGRTSTASHQESGISPILFTRLTSIVFLISGALAYNALYIQSIGSGLSIYSGLFQVTVLSQSFDLFIFTLASLILIPWGSLPISTKLSSGSVNPSEVSSLPSVHSMDEIHVGHTTVQHAVPYSLQAHTGIISYITGPIVSEYSLILLFTTLGSSLLLSSGNLLSMYLSIELQSFGVYILATIYRNSESATSAGLKYFLLGGLSSCLILLGCVLIYSYTGLIYFEDIYSLMTASVPFNSYASYGSEAVAIPSILGAGATSLPTYTIIQLGLILIFIGFLFKIAASPFHNWAPDVYNDVPTIVTTWLSIMPKIAIIIISFEIISTINIEAVIASMPSGNWTIGSEAVLGGTALPEAGAGFPTNLIKILFLISSFLSLIIGTIVGLAQIKIKRLLAYSTISHVGFLLLALSINTEESLESLLFYLIQYSFTNLNTFFILLCFGYVLSSLRLSKKSMEAAVGYPNQLPGYADISLISELKGQFWSNPLLSLSLTVSLFSMAGIPPLVGFFAKAQILYSATQNGYYFISIVAIIVSVISAYYYLQIIKVMHFDTKPSTDSVSLEGEKVLSNISEAYGIEQSPSLVISNTHSFIISTLTLSLLLFILNPSILLNSIHLLALNIFYS